MSSSPSYSLFSLFFFPKKKKKKLKRRGRDVGRGGERCRGGSNLATKSEIRVHLNNWEKLGQMPVSVQFADFA
jgi:hypothetical protein